MWTFTRVREQEKLWKESWKPWLTFFVVAAVVWGKSIWLQLGCKEVWSAANGSSVSCSQLGKLACWNAYSLEGLLLEYRKSRDRWKRYNAQILKQRQLIKERDQEDFLPLIPLAKHVLFVSGCMFDYKADSLCFHAVGQSLICNVNKACSVFCLETCIFTSYPKNALHLRNVYTAF